MNNLSNTIKCRCCGKSFLKKSQDRETRKYCSFKCYHSYRNLLKHSKEIVTTEPSIKKIIVFSFFSLILVITVLICLIIGCVHFFCYIFFLIKCLIFKKS